jgi:23S rRNA (adenine2503-C2)-methyltransferase
MHVNLLRYNATGLSLRGKTYERSSEETSEEVVSELRTRGIGGHFPRSRGPDIDAACGQLRRRATVLE